MEQDIRLVDSFVRCIQDYCLDGREIFKKDEIYIKKFSHRLYRGGRSLNAFQVSSFTGNDIPYESYHYKHNKLFSDFVIFSEGSVHKQFIPVYIKYGSKITARIRKGLIQPDGIMKNYINTNHQYIIKYDKYGRYFIDCNLDIVSTIFPEDILYLFDYKSLDFVDEMEE